MSETYVDDIWFEIDGIKNKWLDVQYATQSEAQKLDIYLPDEGDGPFPVIFLIHGGGWMFGDKRTDIWKGIMKAYSAGYALVSANYRLCGEAKWPAHIYDLKAAIRFLRANAKKYKLDTDKIAVMGESAGGHLAGLLGTSGDVAELEDLTQGNPEQSSRVQAVVGWYGSYNFMLVDEQRKELHTELDDGNRVMTMLFGKPMEEIPHIVEMASPDTHLSPSTPPCLLQHGNADMVVPYLQSVDFAEKLEKVIGKDKVELIIYDGIEHGIREHFTSDSVTNKVLDFLDLHLLKMPGRKRPPMPEIGTVTVRVINKHIFE